jgi:hypothetical protein
VICSAFLHVSRDPIAGVNQAHVLTTKECMIFSVRTNQNAQQEVRLAYKKGGNLSKRQLVSFLHSNRKLIDEMKVAKMNRIG